MSTTIVMPQLGESVAEGVINKWLKGEGDSIEKDEPIVEVVTDKVNAEIPSPVAGVLEKIEQPEGATVAVGQPIAVIGSGTETSDNGGTAAPQPVAVQAAADTAPQAPQQVEATPARESGRADRVRSSPLVRRLAEQYGINLGEVPGTGIGGRVSKQDILSFIETKETAAEPAAGAAPQPAAAPTPQPAPAQPVPQVPMSPTPIGERARPLGPNEELVPLSPIRKMIAQRMVQSMFTIPHAVTVVEVDMTNVVRYRDAKKDEFRKREGVALSFVAFAVKAVVDALKAYPLVNSEWSDDGIILKKDININVAVDAPEGLITPVIQHADDKSLAGVSKAVVDLADRARSRKLQVNDMQGGTFTVNNTGALGSLQGVSIINFPQAGILSTGTIVKRPVVLENDGEDMIAVRSMMNLSFSFDHRILDGGTASAFLNSVKAALESWPADYPLY